MRKKSKSQTPWDAFLESNPKYKYYYTRAEVLRAYHGWLIKQKIIGKLRHAIWYFRSPGAASLESETGQNEG